MSDISTFRAERYKETLYKNHQEDIKKLKANNRREFNQENKRGKTVVGGIQDEYESKARELRSLLERKLNELREHHNDLVDIENERLNAEVRDLKVGHQDQVRELKDSQENQVTSINDSHKRSLDIAKEKYEKERMKFDD